MAREQYSDDRSAYNETVLGALESLDSDDELADDAVDAVDASPQP